jgi:hypothetical protein
MTEVMNRPMVVEEKVDGANAGISFDGQGALHLQSRGHFLRGGPRETQFHLFHAWAQTHQARLWSAIGARYVIFGEWLYAKHTIFYDNLPHYFLEFDVFDKEENCFLSTPRRLALLAETPLVSVPPLYQGIIDAPDALRSLIGPSRLKTVAWEQHLVETCLLRHTDVNRALRETDPTDLMEGIYIKVEDDGQVKDRYKMIRSSFRTAVVNSEGHWLDRPIIPNRLREGVDLFE